MVDDVRRSYYYQPKYGGTFPATNTYIAGGDERRLGLPVNDGSDVDSSARSSDD